MVNPGTGHSREGDSDYAKFLFGYGQIVVVFPHPHCEL